MCKVSASSLETFLARRTVLEDRIQYSAVRVQYSTVRIQYSTVRVQYSTVRVQYSTVRVQYSTVRVQYSTVRNPNVFCDGHLQIINFVGIVQIRRDFLITLYMYTSFWFNSIEKIIPTLRA
jgi:hypothetical protein